MKTTDKIVVLDIKRRDSRMHGRVRTGETMTGHHAVIEPGKSIRLYGVEAAGSRYVRDSATGRMLPNAEPMPYSRRFAIGDVAEYNAYNLSYCGTIVAIGEKTVTIEDHGQKHRLELADFARRNRHFDLAETAKRNAEWMD